MKKKQFLYFLPLIVVLGFIVFNVSRDHVISGGQSFQEYKVESRNRVVASTDKKIGQKEVVSRRPAQLARQIPNDMQNYFNLRNKKPKGEAPRPEARNISGEYLDGPYQRGYQFLNKTRAYKLSKEIIELFPNGHQHLGFWIAEDNGNSREEGLDVVYNDQRNSYAVLTGILKVKYQDSRDAEHFRGETEGFEHESYPHISSALYRYQDKAFLFKAQKLCLENPSLEICEVEMLEHDRGSR